MIPVDQTKLHDPPRQNGNCVPAVLASLLEMDISDVPEFEEMDESQYFWSMINWLRETGYHLVQWDKEVHVPGYHIAHGPGPRGVDHVVIYYGTEMVHDPHPSRAGLVTVSGVWALLPHDPMRRLP